MTEPLRKGTEVHWKWGGEQAEGCIAESFTRRVSRTIKGKRIVRNASRDEPAYLIVQTDGDRVLKSHSEISRR
jgi:hypothetical protein